MKEPIVSISGVRGIVGESLTPERYMDYILAYATMIGGGKVVVGSDTRISRELMKHICFAGLMSCGCEIIDIGIVPTPTVAVIVKEEKASGGIVITASHNPRQWNAFKFFSSRGEFITKAELDEMLKIYNSQNFKRVGVDELKKVRTRDDADDIHINKLFKFIDVEKIKLKKIKVVVDCCNGAGYKIIPSLLDKLNCEKVILFNDKDADFPHPPEPLPQNLIELSQAVKDHKADIGFAVDPDADRLVVVDENGNHIGEERTITIAADYLLPRLKSPIVVNLSTTMAVDDVGRKHGVKVIRSQIGESNVVNEMNLHGSKIGGEGNGGVILPDVHAGRDAITGIGIFLELISESGKTLSQYNDTIPKYIMRKDKISIEKGIINYDEFKIKFTERFGQPENISKEDGLKLTYKDSWVHIRPSGTEPIIRIFSEAKTEAQLEEIMSHARSILG